MDPRRLLLWGFGLWTLLVAELVVLRLLVPDIARATLLGMTAEIFAGREVGIPVALDEGAPTWLVLQVSCQQDVASALLVYPMFLWALHKYHDADTVVMRRFRRIENAADRHRHYVDRWGPLGIGVFMLVPFLVNGPMVGLVLGRLTGIRSAHILPPVIIATGVAATLWTFAFDIMLRAARVVDPAAGRWIAGTMLAIVVGLVVMDWVRDHRKHTKGE